MTENLLKNCKWQVEETKKTVFINELDIYQDGTLPMCRDRDGVLWTMSGHSHLGHIGMFSGTCLEDLKEVYPIQTNFSVGDAGIAFDNTLYPEGVLPRGSVWPFGLYICPNTDRFFCFFHNETGWNAHKTGYIITGPGDGEPDFRHIGLMYSDDKGRNWNFLRWVVTAEAPCYSELYRPDNIPIGGQKEGYTCLGAGDFSLYTDSKDEYLYLFYNLLYVHSDDGAFRGCDVYVARSRKRTDGMMGDFVKYYNGSFCEAGNMGKESIVVPNAWHPRVLYSRTLDCYIMSSTKTDPNIPAGGNAFSDEHWQLHTSKDLLNWSEPLSMADLHPNFRTHYFTVAAEGIAEYPTEIDNIFSVLSCHNGTDMRKNRIIFE